MNGAQIKRGLKKCLKNPWYALVYMNSWGLLNPLSDESYLRLMFRAKFGRKLDLENPRSFNEKLQWIKLYDREPEYTEMVDKYEAKRYVAERIGEKYIIPTIGVWDCFEDIDFDALPDQFVLKCTHDSGGLIICKDKSKLDREAAARKIRRSLKNNYYLQGREWPYKNVKPRIIAEKYMENSSTHELRDYKFYFMNGKLRMLLIVTDRGVETTRGDYFDAEGNHLDMRWGFPNASEVPAMPENLNEMRVLAEKLAADITQLRVDFYNVDGNIYFGEMTFFDGGGFQTIEPYEQDLEMGSWLQLPQKKA